MPSPAEVLQTRIFEELYSDPAQVQAGQEFQDPDRFPRRPAEVDGAGNVIAGSGGGLFFPQGPENATPDQVGDYIYNTFLRRGRSPQDAQFALLVATGESGLIRDARGDGGESHGTWQLHERGLLPAFHEWAERTGNREDPNDPISSTLFVMQYVAANGNDGYNGWQPWTVARNAIDGGQGPQGNRSAASNRIEFPSERGLREAQTTRSGVLNEVDRGQLAENVKQGAFNRPLSLANLQEGQANRRSSNQQAAVQALIQALPFTGNPGQEFAPGFQPGGPASTLSSILGTGFQPARMGPSTTLSLNQLANQPNPISEELMALLAAAL